MAWEGSQRAEHARTGAARVGGTAARVAGASAGSASDQVGGPRSEVRFTAEGEPPSPKLRWGNEENCKCAKFARRDRK